MLEQLLQQNRLVPNSLVSSSVACCVFAWPYQGPMQGAASVSCSAADAALPQAEYTAHSSASLGNCQHVLTTRDGDNYEQSYMFMAYTLR